MELYPAAFIFVIDETKSMAAESMHMTIAVRSTTIGEKEHNLVQAFRIVTPEVPHHRRAFCICAGISFLSMNKIREFFWILDEEDRCIISNKVPVAIFSIRFQSKSPWVPFSISRTFLTAHCGETKEYPGFFSYLAKDLCSCIFCDIVCYRKSSISACALGMHHSFRNALAVK